MNWCIWTVVLEKTLESPLDCKEIQPVHPKGNQPWLFIGRTDAEAEAPTLWPPDVKSWLTGKDPDAGKDWGQKENKTTEDVMVGWHHWLNGHEFEQTLGDSEGQESLLYCSTPVFPVQHQFLEPTQTHVHLIVDAIQPSHPLSSSSPPAFNLSQHQGLLKWVLPIRWPEYWHFSFSICPSKEYSGLISFRKDRFDLFAVQGPLKSLLQHHSLEESILSAFFIVQLTSIHDYWKNHGFDCCC